MEIKNEIKSSFFLSEISLKLKKDPANVARELEKLAASGLISITLDNGKKYYSLNFDFIINTWEIGLPKASEQTIRYIMKKFKVNADEIIYIDDQEENLLAAKKMGVRTIFYKNFAQFKREIDNLLFPSLPRACHEFAEGRG